MKKCQICKTNEVPRAWAKICCDCAEKRMFQRLREEYGITEAQNDYPSEGDLEKTAKAFLEGKYADEDYEAILNTCHELQINPPKRKDQQ